MPWWGWLIAAWLVLGLASLAVFGGLTARITSSIPRTP